MLGIIQSELLKMRHTFSMKLVIMAPLVTLLLSYLLSGSYVQFSSYNWWYFMGYIPTVLVSLAANITLSAIVAEKDWFLFVPYAIPVRIVCPFFKMHVNGLPLENDSPLLEGGYVLPALIISLAFALVIFLVSSKLLSRGGRTHE